MRGISCAAVFFSDIAFANQAFTFEMPAAEEPGLRAFLEQAARSAGRPA